MFDEFDVINSFEDHYFLIFIIKQE